ncbi:membrane protein insertion efficiency factor YidD [Undibacterium cyanobacteriorum]|uniref:Putative membrane protein insertion efficiency factor n=1 Tax=Undibacterium cyanobacteriorum TaxID=3073561 RepID=A0ABY9RIU2_9BURK|nr:membrane protein insertion efficiency factor YidD [Undibacterium sp. 20NA77.5]WMW80758.1 membrane protein insertion efficiency factor YidD [Undibacterium sp. 20NA77.5]
MKALLLLLLRGYKLAISPMLGQNCRFYPSCSEYAAEAIREYGALRGSWMAGKRLCKCHPWHPGGVDLVPCKHHQHDGHEKDGVAPTSDSGTPQSLPSTSSKSAGSHQFE